MSRSLPIYGGLDAGARPQMRDAVLDALESGQGEAAALGLGLRAMDFVVTEHARVSGHPPPACSRGCAYCCHQRVDVTEPELRLLAEQLGEDGALRARIEATARKTEGLGARDHHQARIACALLGADASCSVHAHRPLACRRAHSLDAGVCRDAFDDPRASIRVPDDPSLTWNTAGVALGYREGFEHAGRPLDTYELNAGLARLLRNEPLDGARTHSAAEIRELL